MTQVSHYLRRAKAAGRHAVRSSQERWAYREVSGDGLSVAREVRRRGLTYCTPAQLASLAQLCARFEKLGEPGAIIEAGCARGGSALVMCAVKAPSRALRVYDVFGMIPPPTVADGPDMQARYDTIASGQASGPDGGRYYAYEDDLDAQVAASFVEFGYPLAEHHVTLVKGKVQDTLVVEEPTVLAHIDVDWHEPVLASLERIVPSLSPHGAVVLHAYNDWSGCRSATDEYFDRVGRDGFSFDDSAGHLVVARRA